AATSHEPPISRSAVEPLFSMVRYPPAILAPPGVTRLQACVITRSPALTSSAQAGAARKYDSIVAHAIARVIDMSASLSICIFSPLLTAFSEQLAFTKRGSRDARYPASR